MIAFLNFPFFLPFLQSLQGVQLAGVLPSLQ